MCLLFIGCLLLSVKKLLLQGNLCTGPESTSGMTEAQEMDPAEISASDVFAPERQTRRCNGAGMILAPANLTSPSCE
jgi:hypothetical protein